VCGTALAVAVAVALDKTQAAVEGAAGTTPVTGASIATTDSCFGTSAVEAAVAEVGSRSTFYDALLRIVVAYTCGCEAAEVVIVAVERRGTFKYDCAAVLVGTFEYVCVKLHGCNENVLEVAQSVTGAEGG